MSTRVYVSTSLTGLAVVMASGGIGPVPFVAHAETDRLKAEYADVGEEEWEYAAMSAAAKGAIGMLTEDDPPRRVVLALDAATVAPVDGAEPSLVEVQEVVKTTDIAAVHVDSVDAEDDVRAAAGAWADAEAGDETAQEAVDRALDRELGWFAAQEIGDLLDELTGR
ncbi:MAG: DUF6912 family protein [Actinomycetes bacterium]